MKKILFLLGVLGILASCKPKQPAVATTSVDRKTQVSLKGDWTLSSVSYTGSDYIKVNAFQITEAKCFEGSLWHFISNNDSGKVKLNKPNCLQYESDFKWYISDDGQFVLKLLKNGDRPRKVDTGYILTISNVTDNSFQLTDKLDIGGSKSTIVYTFKRLEEY